MKSFNILNLNIGFFNFKKFSFVARDVSWLFFIYERSFLKSVSFFCIFLCIQYIRCKKFWVRYWKERFYLVILFVAFLLAIYIILYFILFVIFYSYMKSIYKLHTFLYLFIFYFFLNCGSIKFYTNWIVWGKCPNLYLR